MTPQQIVFAVLIAGGAWMLLLVTSGLMTGKYRFGGKVLPDGVATSVVFALIGTFYTTLLIGIIVTCVFIVGSAIG